LKIHDRTAVPQIKPVGQPVWPGTWSNDASAKMIRRDLADTRKAWLESFQDERQRKEMARSKFLPTATPKAV
jgi:hypothetical protein